MVIVAAVEALCVTTAFVVAVVLVAKVTLAVAGAVAANVAANVADPLAGYSQCCAMRGYSKGQLLCNAMLLLCYVIC